MIIINIIVFGLVLGLSLSNSHTIFLLIPHLRSLNIIINSYNIFRSDSSYKLFNKCLTIPPLPYHSHSLSNHPKTITCQRTIPVTYRSASLFPVPNILPNTQFPNPITILTTQLSTVPLTSKYSPQHSVP